MNFSFSPEQEKLRHEVRQFLVEELGTEHIRMWAPPSGDKEFTRKVAQRGWIGITLPKEYGGAGGSYVDRLVVMEEMLRFGAPIDHHAAAEMIVGPALAAYGSEELKREFLPKIVRGEIKFSALYSEPNAGTDSGAIETTAVEDGEEFVINGQKSWCCGVMNSVLSQTNADYAVVSAITDPQGPRYKNYSEFIIDLKKPGVMVSPVIDPAGLHHFNYVFLDNCRVPRRYIIGQKNRGFHQVTSQVNYVRAGLERPMRNYPEFEAILRYLQAARVAGRPIRNLAVVRDKLADLKVLFEAARLLTYRAGWLLDQGKNPNLEAAMAKEFGTRFGQRLANVVVDILGLGGLLRKNSRYAPLQGIAALGYIESPAWTIQGGSSEIMHYVIGRELGLPVR